jgi:hypothetical protein
MNNSVFTTRDIVKYFIIAGIVYTILKLIPSSKLMEKDLILLLSIITVGFVCLDCMFKRNTKEKFMDNNDLLQYAKKTPAQPARSALPARPALPAQPALPGRPMLMAETQDEEEEEEEDDVQDEALDEAQDEALDEAQDEAQYEQDVVQDIPEEIPEYVEPEPMENKNTIGLLKLEIAKVDAMMKNLYTIADIQKAKDIKEDLLNKLRKLQPKPKPPPKAKAGTANSQLDAYRRGKMNNSNANLNSNLDPKITNDDIAYKYYESLIVDLLSKGIIERNDVENIRVKLQSKLSTLKDVIKSLEIMKREGRSKQRQTNGKVRSDYEYSELPTDFYKPIGDKIANDWDNEYAILNTNKWQVPMTRPPVCINTAPCKVCPNDASNYNIDIKQWDESRTISGNKINKKWAADQNSS